MVCNFSEIGEKTAENKGKTGAKKARKPLDRAGSGYNYGKPHRCNRGSSTTMFAFPPHHTDGQTQKSSVNFLRRLFRRAAARLVARVLPAAAVVAAGIAWSAPVSAQMAGICDRTQSVRDAIVGKVGGNCASITSANLAAVTGALTLSGGGVTSLSAGDFAGLVNLKELHLTQAPFTTLPANVFAGLAKLEKLNLTDTRLTTLPANLFAGLGELKELKIQRMRLPDHTGLTTLPANVFAGLAKLEKLNLGGNQITTLPANVFAGLGELQQLQLWGTHLATIPANAFANLPNLTELFLSDNSKLTTLPANVFAGLGKLSYLDLFRNTALTTISAGAFNGLSPGALKINGLVLPAPPGEVRLTPLDGEMRAEWDAVSGARYQVRWKDVSAAAFAPEDAAAAGGANYTITGLQNGATYEVRVASVPSAPQTTTDLTTWGFASAQRIMRGVCGRTASVRDVIVGKAGVGCEAVTAGHLRAITEMNLAFAPSGTGGTLSENDFAGMDNLRILRLNATNPKLTALPENVFAGLSKLRELHLPGNQLSSLPAGVFAGLSELRKLALSHNQLTTLPENVFADLAKLNTLELVNNPLASLPTGVFNGLTPGFRVAGITRLQPPQNFRLTPRAGGLRAEWDAVSGAHYQLHWKRVAAAAFAPEDSVAVEDADTSYTITGLASGTTYEVHVASVPKTPARVTDSNLYKWPFDMERGVPPFPPGTPGNLTVRPRGSQELYVEWSAPPVGGGRASVTGYRVRWKPVAAAGFAPSDVRDVNNNLARSHGLSGLTNDTAYEVQVAAKSAVGDSGYTAGVQGTPRLGICSMPEQAVRGQILRALNLGARFCGAATDAQLATIKTLTFSGGLASFNTLPANAFAGLTGLENLLIEKSSYLQNLSANAFAGLPSLKKLDVRENPLLTTLPVGVFAGLANLEELNLSVNGFSALPGNRFADLANLKKLDLGNPDKSVIRGAYNGITILSADAFAGLGKLEELNLGGNHFTALPANVFAGLGELKVLHLNQTKITALPANAFADLAKLEELDLSGNTELRAFETGAFDGLLLEKLAVTGAALPDTPSVFNLTPGRTKLRAVWNESPGADYQLHWKPFTAATFAPADRATVAAPTLTYDITGLEAQTTYQVRLTALPKRQGVASSATARWTFAEEFAATANKPGAPLNPRVQARESEKLRVSWAAPANDGGSPVSAYRVRWKPLAAADFADADTADVAVPRRGGLQYDISGLTNGATYEVQVAARNLVGQGSYTDSVRGAPLLGICDRTTAVRNAILTRLGRGLGLCGTVTDADLMRVEWLGILGRGSSLPIPSFSPNDFKGLVNLETLLIARTQITELPDGVFSDLTNLHYLSLRENHKLNALPANVFADLPQLQELHLWGNTFTSLPQNAFAGMTELRVLDLHVDKSVSILGHMGIKSLPENAFADLAALEDLDLSGNCFSDYLSSLNCSSPANLPANVFARLGELKVLRLKDANIRTLPVNLFAGLAKLEELDLSNDSEHSFRSKNDISDLPANVFANQSKLTRLDLTGNNSLGAFRAASFNGLRLEKLAVKGIGNMPGNPNELRLTPGERKLRAVWEAVPNANYQLHWKP
ncbi:MAG: leucine-rich repeat protein, partial [Alphaproteobacteria bacterium]|nr:leucine-rich repeat protein [Alphaproteobacteria bacterium]